MLAEKLDVDGGAPAGAERRFVLHGVPWWTYVAYVYAGLGVPEVWIWRPEAAGVQVHRLVEERYGLHARSEILPDIDVAELSRHVKPGESQTALARAYQASLRRSTGTRLSRPGTEQIAVDTQRFQEVPESSQCVSDRGAHGLPETEDQPA